MESKEDERIFRIMSGATGSMSEASINAAVRLLMRIEEHKTFIALLQRGELVAHRNAEGEDVFYAREFDPTPEPGFCLPPTQEGN